MKTPPQKRRTKTEQVALTITLGFLSIAACGYVVISYYGSVKTHIERIAESAFMGTASDVANWIEEKKTTIDLLGKGLSAFGGKPETIQPLLKQTRVVDLDFIDIFYGTSTTPAGGGYAVYASDWKIPAGYDWTTRPWYQQAVTAGRLMVTKPYKDLQTGRTIISVSKPVIENGVLAGVISADIATSTVKGIIERVYTSRGSIIRLIDAEGNLINIEDSITFKSGNVFAEPELAPWKKQILSGAFSMRIDPVANRYYANIGLPELGWIMVADGSLSSFEDLRGTVIKFSAVLLFLAGLFMLMLARTWRSNAQLSLATEAIERANRDLEQTVNERTASLRNILDSAEEGFFTFGESLAIDPNYSKGCADIFAKDIKGLSAPDVIFPGMTQVIADFRQGFDLYFKGKTRAEIIFDLTEKQTTIRGRTIRITYKETAGQRILCILTDVTLELEIAEKNRREAETQKRILRAIHNRHFFAQFLSSADNLFEILEVHVAQDPTDDERADLMRAIHTFKGDAGFFGFLDSQNAAHESETLIGDSVHLQTTISWKEILIQLRKAYYRELKTITDTMGERWLDDSTGVTMPHESFQKLIDYIRKKTPDDSKLLAYLDSFRKVTLSELFSRLPFAAAVTAERLGKKIRPMTIAGGTQKIVPDRYLPLVESCVHIVNNMVDHGIEYPYEREAIQKQPEGRIELSITVEKSNLILEFQDDGRGINPREIERVARQRGLIPEGRSLQNSELYALLFADGFSTRKDVTATSGRGVGLAAVKAEVSRLGGAIEVRSKLGKGTLFEITIPLSTRN